MKEHVDAAQRQSSVGDPGTRSNSLTFSQAVETYRERLESPGLRPNTKAWPVIDSLKVRKITSRTVEDWLRKFKNEARPYVPKSHAAC